MKKVLHVGITAPSYSSEAITQSFKEVFGDVLYFDWQSHRFNYGIDGMRINLCKQVISYKPDIIFLHFNHNNEALDIPTHQFLQNSGAKVITYTEDVREDISWFETISPLVELMIFTNIDDVEKLKEKRFDNAAYLPVSYNNIWYKKQPKTLKYYGDIVFLGNNYVGTNVDFPQAQQRQEMITALKKEFGNRFQAYGRGQENPPLNPQEAVECYNNAKIAIGHNNFTRKGYHSDRVMNSMGCGCLTETQFCESDFCLWGTGNWKTTDDLIHKCKLLLNNPELIPELAEAQYKEVAQNHTWYNRAKSIEQIINGNT